MKQVQGQGSGALVPEHSVCEFACPFATRCTISGFGSKCWCWDTGDRETIWLISSHIPVTVFPAHSSDRWKRRQALHSSAQASSSPLRAGRPWPAGPPREARGERNGQAQRLSLKRWYETVTISKQLDSDRRAAYVPENAGAGSTPGRNKTQSDV